MRRFEAIVFACTCAAYLYPPILKSYDEEEICISLFVEAVRKNHLPAILAHRPHTSIKCLGNPSSGFKINFKVFQIVCTNS